MKVRPTVLVQSQSSRTQLVRNKNSITSDRSEIERQKGDCCIVLDGLKEMCVSNICHSGGRDVIFNSNNSDEYGQRRGVSKIDVGYRKEREHEREKYLMHFEKACDDLLDPDILTAKNDLEGPHFVAAALTDFLKCVRGVYLQRALYRIDVHSWMGEVKNDCNPLCALLSLPSLNIESKHTRETRHYKIEETCRDNKRRDSERKVECCRLLLSMGVSPFYPDKSGRIPVVTVALGGDDNGPSLLLEMLSHLPFDHHSMKNKSSSRTSSTGVSDQNLKPGTSPVRMQRCRILEGDDFKYLVWHVLMGCPARDTSPSSIPFYVRKEEGNGAFDSDFDGIRSKYMGEPKLMGSKMSAATKKLLNAEHASRNRVQVAILSILLDCGFPGNILC